MRCLLRRKKTATYVAKAPCRSLVPACGAAPMRRHEVPRPWCPRQKMKSCPPGSLISAKVGAVPCRTWRISSDMKRTGSLMYWEKTMRLAGRIALIFVAVSSGPAVAGSLDCSSVLTDTSRSLSARRELARECLASACRQEARDLELAQEATSRFMEMCLADQSDVVSGEGSPSGTVADARTTAGDAACVTGTECKDLSMDLEATAAGLRSGARADAGHSFVRVLRINEVLER